MSGTHGLIPHQAGYHYITLEEDYVLMFQRSADAWYERTDKSDEKQKEYAARRAHAVAKAYISSVLEQLSDKQFKSGKPEKEIWVFLSFPEIENRIHGGVKMRTLKDAMKEMIEDKYVEKLPNPDRHFKNLIYHMNFKQYRLELQLLPQRLGDSANLHDGKNESANTHDDSANLHDDDANTHSDPCKSAPKNNIRDNKEETKNNESTFPAIPATPTASSHDEDAHALSLSSESCSEHKEQEDSQMMEERASTDTDELSALGLVSGKAEPLIASATEQDEHAIAEQMKAAFPLPPASTPTRLTPRSSSKQTNKATSESGGKIVPLRETGPQFASREAAALHRRWKETYGAYGDARWDVEAIHWIAGEGGTFEDIQLIYKDLKREKATRAVKPDLVKQNWYRLHDLKHASEGQATYSNHPMMVDLSAKFGSDLSYKAMSMGR